MKRSNVEKTNEMGQNKQVGIRFVLMTDQSTGLRTFVPP